MRKEQLLDRILFRYKEKGYSWLQRAKIIFVLNVAAFLIILVVTIYVIYVNPVLSPVTLIAMPLGSVLIAANAWLVTRGYFSLPSHMLFIVASAVIWIVIFVDTNDPVTRMDSIAYILGILPLASIISWRKRRVIIFYGAINIFITLAFMYVHHDNLAITNLAKIDYLVDNILSLIFITTLSYQVVTINNRALNLAEEEIFERKIAAEELEKKNRELNNMIQQNAATMEELEATNEEFEAQHREILRSQHELLESENRFRNILEFLPIPVMFVKSQDIVYINPEYTERFGYSIEDFDNLMETWERLFPEKEYQESILKEYLENRETSGPARSIKLKPKILTCKNGNELIVEITITRPSELDVLIIVDDITEKQHSQQMIIQSEKMMTVGNLTAGMAHEINNPLGIILQSIQNTFRRLSPDNSQNVKVAESLDVKLEQMNNYLEKRSIITYLQGIQEASKRAATIVSNMLHFSRKSDEELKPLNINELIERTLEIASQDYDMGKNYDLKKINIIRSFHESLPLVPGIRGELEQVILNLVKNAAHAIHESSGVNSQQGEISISTRQTGNEAVIEIADNGPGIPEEIKKSIFEPFITTKKAGSGTGLGLFVCYSIITNHHNGRISVSSFPDKGTTFTVRLPV